MKYFFKTHFTRVDRSDGFGTRDSEISFRVRIPTFGHDEFNGTRLLDDFAKDPNGFVVAYIFKVDIVHLKDHISRFDPAVQSDRSALHDAADVDAPVPASVRLTDDGDAEKVDRVHVERDRDYVQGHGRVGDAAVGARAGQLLRPELASPLEPLPRGHVEPGDAAALGQLFGGHVGPAAGRTGHLGSAVEQAGRVQVRAQHRRGLVLEGPRRADALTLGLSVNPESPVPVLVLPLSLALAVPLPVSGGGRAVRVRAGPVVPALVMFVVMLVISRAGPVPRDEPRDDPPVEAGQVCPVVDNLFLDDSEVIVH